MKQILIVIQASIVALFLCLPGCAMFGDQSPEEISKSNVKRELGWRSALVAYDAEIDKCTPIKTESCILDSDDTLTVDDAIDVFAEARTTCLAGGICNTCGLATAASKIANVIGNRDLVDLDAVCIRDDFDLESILVELEEIPPELVEQE